MRRHCPSAQAQLGSSIARVLVGASITDDTEQRCSGLPWPSLGAHARRARPRESPPRSPATSHPRHPPHRSRTRTPPSAAHTHRPRRATTPPLVARVSAGAQRCPLTSSSTRVECGARRRPGGGGTVQAGQDGALAPGAGHGVHPRALAGASEAVGPGPERPERHDYIGFFSPLRSLAKTDETIHLSFVIGVYSPKESAQF